ncbi:MAG: hypothetical protein ACT4P1_16440 [Sporichthyaceae bacterium]
MTLGFGGPDEGKIARQNYERLMSELVAPRDALAQVAQTTDGVGAAQRRTDRISETAGLPSPSGMGTGAGSRAGGMGMMGSMGGAGGAGSGPAAAMAPAAARDRS